MIQSERRWPRIGISKQLATAILLLILTIVLFAPLAVRPLNGDPALYAYIGDRMAQGDVIYRDVWDVKPPGFPWLYQLSFHLFGRDHQSPAKMEIILVWLTIWGLWQLAYNFGGAWAGWGAALLYLAGYLGVSLEGMSLQAEGFAGPFLVWPLVLALQGPVRATHATFSGILLAYATLIKTALIVFVAPWLLMTGLGRHLIPFVSSAFGIGALSVIYLKLNGVLGEARYTLLTFGPQFVTARRQPLGPTLTSALPHIAGGMWLVVAGGVAGLVCSIIRRDLAALLLGMILSLALIFWQSTFWNYHWCLFFLFASVPFGVLIGILAQKFNRLGQTGAILFFALLGVPKYGVLIDKSSSYAELLTGGTTWLEYAAQIETIYGEPYITEDEMYELSMFIKQNTRENECIFTFLLSPSISFYAQRREPSRFTYSDGLDIPAPRQSLWQEEYITAVIEKRPKFIVVCRDWRLPHQERVDLMAKLENSPRLYDFFHANYRKIRTVGGALDVYQFNHP